MVHTEAVKLRQDRFVPAPMLTLASGTTVAITGKRLRGVSEAGSGRAGAASDVPVVRLVGPISGGRWTDGSDGLRTLTLPAQAFATGDSLTFAAPASGVVAQGHHLLRVTVNGIPSEARIVRFP